MKHIISGTNRPGSRTLEISKLVQSAYATSNETVDIIDLGQVGLEELSGGEYSDRQPLRLRTAIEAVSSSDGLIVVCPEYNGSMPGALKYFIDHWKYPDSYEFRPVAMIGLGGRFGGLRPVEHLQQVFGYRNAYIYPERVFISNVWNILKDGKLTDEKVKDQILSQVKGFQAFTLALSRAGLDANSKLKSKSS